MEALAHADRPGHRRAMQLQHRFDLVEQFQRIAHFAVHLVDEGDDRRVAQAADFEQLDGLFFDALGRVDHHHGGIDGGQHAVGVFREILVAGGVEQVDDAIVIAELHHRAGHRNAALLFDSSQSEVAYLPLLRAFTVPAIWIAPPNSSSFSVSVVLPASGWEMMAKVRRLATWRANVGCNRGVGIHGQKSRVCRAHQKRVSVRAAHPTGPVEVVSENAKAASRPLLL
jgi:hypothetical protein